MAGWGRGWGTLDVTNDKMIVEAAVSHATAVGNLESQAHSVVTSSTMAFGVWGGGD